MSRCLRCNGSGKLEQLKKVDENVVPYYDPGETMPPMEIELITCPECGGSGSEKRLTAAEIERRIEERISDEERKKKAKSIIDIDDYHSIFKWFDQPPDYQPPTQDILQHLIDKKMQIHLQRAFEAQQKQQMDYQRFMSGLQWGKGSSLHYKTQAYDLPVRQVEDEETKFERDWKRGVENGEDWTKE